MKKVILFLAMLMVWASCQKKDLNPIGNSTSNPRIFSSLTACDAQFNQMVNSGALGIINLSRDTAFRSLVYSKIAERFDGDDNVLLKDLVTYPNSLTPTGIASNMKGSILQYYNKLRIGGGVTSYSNFGYYSDSSDVVKLVNGFEVCDETHYLQIYVPFVDSVNLSGNPVIVIGFEENEDCIVPGYILQNDSLTVIDVDETYARNNLVWVVSVNEMVDENGVYEDPDAFAPGGSESIVGLRDFPTKQVRVREIYITDKKECWLCGMAEISVAGIYTNGTNCSVVTPAQQGINAANFKKVANRDLNSWIWVGDRSLARLTSRSHFVRPYDESIQWVFYERDAAKKSYYRVHNGVNCSNPPQSGTSVNFYSAQTAYGTSGSVPIHYDYIPGTTSFTAIATSFINSSGDFTGGKIRFDGAKTLE